MPTVIRIGGQIYATSRTYRHGRVAGEGRPVEMNERDDGKPCDGTPIPPDSADSTFRAGTPYHDEHEDVVYRVIHKINVAEGWGTAAFWMKRWGCYHTDLLTLVRRGWLDAAIEAGSAVKRYRCRDEMRVQEWLTQFAAKPAAPAPKPKPIKKSAAPTRRWR